MTFILETVLFVILIYLIFYLPGRFMLRLFKYHLDFWQELPLSIVGGLSVFVLLNYLLAWLKLDSIYCYGVIVLSFAQLIKDVPKVRKLSLQNLPIIEILLILLGSGAMLFITMNSGLSVSG